MADGTEALDCFNPWHAQSGSPAREPGSDSRSSDARGTARDRGGLLSDHHPRWPHECASDVADWQGLTKGKNMLTATFTSDLTDLQTTSTSTWSAVGSMTMCVALPIAAEFMPVSLLT